MDDEKKGFVFYRSFYSAIKELPDAQRLEVYDAICRYALDGIMPETSGIAKAILCLIQPAIDTNNQRWENSKKKSTKSKPNSNQNITKAEANQEQDETKNEANGGVESRKENVESREGKVDSGEENAENTLPPKSPQGDGEKKPSLQERRFEEFWSVYPKKRSRESAWKAWKKIAPDEELCATIVESVKDHIARDLDWKKDNGQFIPHPATYLNSGGWQDEFAQKAPEPEYDPNDPYKYWN